MFTNWTFKKLALMAGSCAVVAAIGVSAWMFNGRLTDTVDAHALSQEAAEQQTIIKTYQAVTTTSHTAQHPNDPAEYSGTVRTFVVEGEGVYVVMSSSGGTAEYLLLQDQQYYRESGDDEWEEMYDSGPGFSFPTLDSAKHAALLGSLDDLEIVGEEMYNGVLTEKIVAKYDMEVRAKSIWGDYDDLDDETRRASTAPATRCLPARSVSWLGLARKTV